MRASGPDRDGDGDDWAALDIRILLFTEHEAGEVARVRAL
ncbi:hypothetical protein NMD1_01887 [Novosphingobium sp. MD-1]|nr:hypothetical protein NMD1_01887 [Novosphingobium sp. MD-1]